MASTDHPDSLAQRMAALSQQARDYMQKRAREGVWVVGPAFTTTFVNPPMADLLGYAPEEMVGRPVSDFIPEDMGPLLEAGAEARRRGEPGTLPFTYRHRDGHRVDAILLSTPMLDSAGHFLGAIARVADLSIIEAASASEREQRERFRAIFEAEAQPVMVTDRENRVLEVNGAARSMLGVPDPIGHVLDRDILPEYLEAAHVARDRALAGEVTRVRLHVRTPDGTLRWVESVLSPLRSANGIVDRVVVLTRDISAELEAQRVHAERLELTENLLAHMPVMIARFEEDGRPSYFNAELERTLGWTAEEAARDPDEFFCRIHPDPEERRDAIKLIQRADSTWFRLRQHARDGRVVEAFCLTRRLADGSVLGIAEDISDRVLLERQLLQSQRLDSIGRLAGGVAHDFNNLLTVILGYGEMLDQALGDGHAGRPMLDEIRQSAGRARDLTAQLLTFARRQVVRPRRVELDELARGTERMLRRLLDEHIELSLELSAAGHPVRVDPSQMEQVILNLVINARDAMPRGGHLRIRTSTLHLDDAHAARHPGTRPGAHVVLEVRDSGQGMDEETLTRIFEPFFSTKLPGHGTGLGLATVHGIVHQSGGHIEVDSTPGEGATFRVFLPEAPTLVEEAEAPEESEPEDVHGSERVWVVEDEGIVRTLTARILRDAGYEVSEIESPHRAMELAARATAAPELLLTDVIMPGMSGRDLAGRLNDRWPGMRVLYLSGYAHDTIVHQGVLDPGVEFLAKPFTPNQLLSRVRQVVGAAARS